MVVAWRDGSARRSVGDAQAGLVVTLTSAIRRDAAPLLSFSLGECELNYQLRITNCEPRTAKNKLPIEKNKLPTANSCLGWYALAGVVHRRMAQSQHSELPFTVGSRSRRLQFFAVRSLQFNPQSAIRNPVPYRAVMRSRRGGEAR